MQVPPARRSRCSSIGVAVCALALGAPRAIAQDDPAAKAAAKAPQQPGPVVARVGDRPVYTSDVEHLLKKATGGKPVNPAARPVLQAQVLREIVDRRLVVAYARRTGVAPSDADVDRALAELNTKLQVERRSLEAYLRQEGINEAALREQVAWNLLWPKCLARYATDDRLASYFQAHHRELDGTELAVSHILLPFAAEAGPEAVRGLVRKAEAIRREVASGQITFADAARKYSSGPSAAGGGGLGYIARHGAMVESFARAAFALDAGQVSPPVVTSFGVHLIRCDEVKPGGKQLSDVRKQVEEALARQLLDNIARYERQHTAVSYTGAWPHFQPGTRELATP